MLVKARYKGVQVALWPVLAAVQALRGLKVGD